MRVVVASILVCLLGSIPGQAKKHAEPVIEDVNAKQLERVVTEKDLVAVFWYARKCKDCDKVLEELENIDDDTDTFGLEFVKINDRKYAKSYGVSSFPALQYFRNGAPITYEGDLMDEEKVLEFLTSLDALELPDQIEEVNAKLLEKVIEDNDFVAVFFYFKGDCSTCAQALKELENIDDDADELGIAFVKIADDELAEEYGLEKLPCLVYYRHNIPVVYDGDLMNEDNVLEWLVSHKSTGDEEDVIEEVTPKTLDTLIQAIDGLAVLFYDNDDKDSTEAVKELENIDDECAKMDIQMVKIDDEGAKEKYGVTDVPTLLFFEGGIPTIYEGDLVHEEKVLSWLSQQVHEDAIEAVTNEMLDQLIKDTEFLAVLFYDDDHKESMMKLEELEKIDDECDQHGIAFVKIDDASEASEYGIDEIPALVYFENGIPSLYYGDLGEEEQVLEWLIKQKETDEIEDVTDEMLDMLIEKSKSLSVLFYDKDQKQSKNVLSELEHIDDECDKNGIVFVKIDNDAEAKEYGIENIPSLVYFENKIPTVYEGDLLREEEVLKWLIHQLEADEIEDVTDEMLDKLIVNVKNLAVLFYDEKSKESDKVLKELENIDDDCDQSGITFVKISDMAEAKEYGIDKLPTMVYFENQIPTIYQGNLMEEEEVLEWLIEQKVTDEIEDITDEILDQLIEKMEFLAVLFYDKEDKISQKVLSELETIDDECDSHGIVFVKISDQKEAKEYGIEELPGMVYFENGIPAIYDGDLMKEEEVLKWVIHQKESDEIEDVTDEIMDKLVKDNEFVTVLFYDKESRKSQRVLKELENIDDDLDQHGILFIKIDDDHEAEEYGIEHLPAIVYFENEIPAIYDGDLTNEEAVLDWLLHQKAADEIEDITDNILDMLIRKFHFLVVLFYEKQDLEDVTILKEMEKIDDDCDKHGIAFVKLDDVEKAHDYGIYHLPGLVYFEDQIPSVYDGDLENEEEVLEWLVQQMNESTIEEVNDDILEDLIENHEYVAVYFKGEGCDEGEHCDSILDELENIDDEMDTMGLVLVTTEDIKFAKSFGVKKFPALLYFRNGVPVQYEGDLQDEDAVLKWLTDEEVMELPDQIEEVNQKLLDTLIMKEEHLAVFFYEENDEESDSVIDDLENIDDDCEKLDIDFVKISDPGIAEEYNIDDLPALVLFKKTVPQVYVGDLSKEEDVLKWLINRKEAPLEDVIEKVDKKLLQVMLREKDHIAVFFYNEVCDGCEEFLEELETIDDDADKYDIGFVKTTDISYAKELGVTQFPSLVYFEEGQPSIFDGDLTVEEEVLDWLIYQKIEDTIENINREMLFKMIEEKEFLAVYFYNEENEDCGRVLKHLELIDDEASEYGIEIVKMNDHLMAKKYGFRKPPGISYFRKGKYIKYDGDLFDEEEVLDWLSDPDNMELNDQIEKVNRKMFKKIRGRSDHIAAFFYSDTACKQCPTVLQELENIDDDAGGAGIKFVKIDDMQLGKDYGVFSLPALLYFRQGSDEPIIYAGDLKNEERILEWLLTEKDPNSDYIEEMSGDLLKDTVRKSDAIAVYIFNPKMATRDEKQENFIQAVTQNLDDIPECEDCTSILEELENIDDDTDKHGIQFVKTQDMKFAQSFGIKTFPGLIYFERGIPSIYEGDLAAEEDVLQWLILQKTEDRIESISRDLLEQMVEETQYLAVYFYKYNCKACDQVLAELENIDDECDVYGIHMVKINDPQLAKRYGIKTFPALIYFRNGNPLIFDGDLVSSSSVLEWLIDEDTRQLIEEIERVNAAMLERLIYNEQSVAVFFYEDECVDCPAILEELENIDDEADMFGIDFVKIQDDEAAKFYGILNTPALVYFRKRIPMVYDGDLLDEESILQWLTSQDVFEIKDEIEEVNKKMLEKLLDENDFVAVYFYDNNCPKCDDVLAELEHIDDETDGLEITFVKIRDPRYARKYGINKLPALIYFRRRFPSLYRGDLMVEEEVLDWLQKNRFKSPELNLFMYIITAITAAFVLYTLFLIFCFKGGHQKTA